MKLDSFESYLAIHSDYIFEETDIEYVIEIIDLENKHIWTFAGLPQDMYMLTSCIYPECYYFFIENRNSPVDLTRMVPREEDPGISKMMNFIKLYENEN